MTERIAVDVTAAETLHARYLVAAAQVHDAAAELGPPLLVAAELIGVDTSAAHQAANLADRLSDDAGDLRWRVEYLIATDATRLDDGRHAGEVPSLATVTEDAALVWSVIFGPLRHFDDDLGPVYRDVATNPRSLHRRWPADAAARFDLTDDACSSPVGNHPWGHDFTLACQKHDFGYRNLKNLDERFSRPGEAVFWNEHSRQLVDEQFGEDLAAVCEPKRGLSAFTCDAAAEAYVDAVRFGGDGFQWHDIDDLVETVQDYLFPWTD